MLVDFTLVDHHKPHVFMYFTSVNMMGSQHV